jgi:hypothetical protein
MRESDEEREQVRLADPDHAAALLDGLTWKMAVKTGGWCLAIGMLLAAITCLAEGGLYWPHWVN